jgi:hypothetical protein
VAYVIVEVPCGQDPISTLRAADANMARVKGQGQAQAIVDIAKVKTMLPGPLQIGSLGREDRADVVVSNMPGYSFPIWCEGGKLIDALATGSLCFPPYFNKMTFITFEDVVYGTMLEDNGPDGGGAEFDREFRTSLEQLCHIGRMRSLIGRQPHFVALSRSDLDRLSLAAEPVTFEAGDAVVTAGAPADSYFVIESGHATVIIDGAPNRTLGPGHSVGEAGILRDGLSAATVMASEHLVAYRIDKAAFVAAFKGDPLNLQPAEIIMEDYLYEPAE